MGRRTRRPWPEGPPCFSVPSRAGFTCLSVLGSVAVFCHFWERLNPQLPHPGSRSLTIAQNSAKLGPFPPLNLSGMTSKATPSMKGRALRKGYTPRSDCFTARSLSVGFRARRGEAALAQWEPEERALTWTWPSHACPAVDAGQPGGYQLLPSPASSSCPPARDSTGWEELGHIQAFGPQSDPSGM